LKSKKKYANAFDRSDWQSIMTFWITVELYPGAA